MQKSVFSKETGETTIISLNFAWAEIKTKKTTNSCVKKPNEQ